MNTNQFFPTPENVAERAASLFMGKRGLLLEPSAGHGDLLAGFEYKDHAYKFQCIEIDPDNVAVLDAKGYQVMQGDFLAAQLPRIYDAVLMNPPFNAGVKHILKAWGLLKQGGELVAIINTSAGENDYSQERKLLNDLIAKYGDFHEIGAAFKDAKNKTNVSCRIVYMKKSEFEEEADFLGGLDRGQDVKEEPQAKEENALIKADFVAAAEEDYQRGIAEVFKGLGNIEKGYKILNSRFGTAYADEVKNLQDIFEDAIHNIAGRYETKKLTDVKNDFVGQIRALAWLTVLDKTEVKKLMYSNDRNAFVSQVLTDSRGISFTKENILGFVQNIFMKRNDIFNGAVKKLFNELRRYHDDNREHTEGWKTNKSWKVPEKIILPYGVTFDKWGHWGTSYHQDYLDDLDRIVRVLDGKPEDYGKFIKAALRDAIDAAREHKRIYSDEIETAYFTLRYFKKGTLHITFKEHTKEIRDRINIIGADESNDIPDMNR